MPEQLSWLSPAWGAPANVRVWVTTRWGGVSEGSFADNNMATHVGDSISDVLANRASLASQCGLDSVQWLEQVHGLEVLQVSPTTLDTTPQADASLTQTVGVALAILTADCLPIVIASEDGSIVGAAHAGWRGLAAGVLEALVRNMRHELPQTHLRAWIGPSIGSCARCQEAGYEVGEEVWGVFAADYPLAIRHHGHHAMGKRDLDLGLVASAKLTAAGIAHVACSNWCSYHDPRFYSHRHHQQLGHQQFEIGVPQTGRTATLISLEPRVR